MIDFADILPLDGILMVIAMSLLLIVSTTLIHYEAITYISRWVQNLNLKPKQVILTVMLIIPFVHLSEILLYAVAYYIIGDAFALGHLDGTIRTDFWSHVYFSAETYSTLGYGDISPRGEARLLAGSEALNGILLIGWSGSYIFLVMQRMWSKADQHHPDQSQQHPNAPHAQTPPPSAPPPPIHH